MSMATWFKGNGIYGGIYVPANDAFPYAMNLIPRSYHYYKEFLDNFKDFNGSLEEFQKETVEWFFSGWNEEEKEDWWSPKDSIPMLDSWRVR